MTALRTNETISFLIFFIFILPVLPIVTFSQSENAYDNEKLNNLLKLTAIGNGYSDQTIIVFIEGSTPGFDPSYDAYKLPGSNAAPQLYSIIPGHNLAINALPEIHINLVVQLGFKVGVPNNYSITASELNTFDPSVTIFLDDTKEGILTNLTVNPFYGFTADPVDNIERFRLYFRFPVRLDIKVMLEGCFSSLEMTTILNQNGLIPLVQPYDNIPWNYNGTEEVPFIPNPDIVDWVLVELRDAIDAGSANYSTTIERRAGFLLKNGAIVDHTGSNLLMFTQTIFENMFVAVLHRNHLGIISSSSPVESAGIFYYDFTLSADQAYGGILAQKEITPGIYGMMGGDINADGHIDESDLTPSWMSTAGLSGYLQSDVNLDGQADNPDKNEIWLKNPDASSQIPE